MEEAERRVISVMSVSMLWDNWTKARMRSYRIKFRYHVWHVIEGLHNDIIPLVLYHYEYGPDETELQLKSIELQSSLSHGFVKNDDINTTRNKLDKS